MKEDGDGLSYRAIGMAMECHRELGPGLSELFYHELLRQKLKAAGIRHQFKPRGQLFHREILVDQFRPFATIGIAAAPVDRAAAGVPQLPPNMLDMPIEELDLPMRASNSLKRNNIVKVGQLLQLKDDDLLRMRNFGKKSLDEMKERLMMRGFILPESLSAPDGMDDDAESDDLPFDTSSDDDASSADEDGDEA